MRIQNVCLIEKSVSIIAAKNHKLPGVQRPVI